MPVLSKLSIRKKFILSSIVTILAMMAVQMFYYVRITYTTRAMVDDYTDSIISQAVSGIDGILNSARQIAYHFSYGSLIEDYLAPKSDYDLYNTWSYQSDMVRTAVETNSNIYDISFFRKDGYIRYQFRNTNLEVRSVLDKYEKLYMSGEIGAGFHCLVGGETQNVRIPAYIQPIYNTSSPLNADRLIGACVVMLRPELLSELLVDIPTNDNSAFFLVDGSSSIVSGTEADPPDIRAFMDRDVVTSRPVGETGWKLVCDVDNHSAVDNYRFFSSFALVVALMMLAFLAILLRILNSSIVSPIYRLHGEIEKVISRNFRKRITMPHDDEIGGIAKAINTMIDHQAATTKQMLTTQQKLYEAQLELQSNELIALENQINPHFLLNTLQCIGGIATACNAPMIVDITANLAGIFHYSLRSSETVTLGDELHCLRRYLAIIDIRFDCAFTWQIDVPEDQLGQIMPKMILQPLVENAVYHGLEKVGAGTVRLTARRQGDDLHILIRDNGAGIPPDTLAELRLLLSDRERMHQQSLLHKRIGVANTCWRLKTMFGEEYGLAVESEPGAETSVLIRMPVQTAEKAGGPSAPLQPGVL